MIKLTFDLLNKIVDKVLSARFLITLAVGLTYCHIVWHAVHFYLKSMVGDPKQMDAFATGLIMGFTGIASFIFKAYFDRSDRAAELKQSPKDAPLNAASASPAPPAAGQSHLGALLLMICLICAGCVFLVRQTDMSISNAEYQGPYCPTGCRADIHYQANTYIGADSEYLRSTNNTTK